MFYSNSWKRERLFKPLDDSEEGQFNCNFIVEKNKSKINVAIFMNFLVILKFINVHENALFYFINVTLNFS